MKQLRKNNMRNLLSVGLIWVGIASAILYMLTSLANSNIHWSRYLITIISLPALIIIIGAFILRTLDDLKELNFMELIRISSGLLYDVIMFLFGNRNNDNRL
jgi:hypothetical protein